MARANTIQTNFTAGELSPLMYGRVDVQKYFNGAKKLQNVIVRPQGGFVRRSGTRFVSEVQNSAKKHRLRRFIFSDAQPYMLEFGDQTLRIYKDGILLVNNLAATIVVSTPWFEADLSKLYFTQSADVIYVTHPNYQTRKVSRILDPTNGFITFTVSTYNNYDGPYLDVDDSGTKLQVTDVVDDAIMSMDLGGTDVAVSSSGIFAAGDPTKYVEFKDKLGRWTLAQVTAFTNVTHDAVTIVSPSSHYYPVSATSITFSGGHVIANVPAFTGASIGKFIRLTASQNWYLITALVSNTTVSATAVSIVTYNTSTVTVTIASSFVSGDVGSFVSYRDSNEWVLAKITSFLSSTTVHVDVSDQIVIPNPAAKITFNTGRIISDLAGVFIPTSDKGKYIRTTDTGLWYQLTGYVSSSAWNATAVTMKTTSYPSVTITVSGRTIVANVVADTGIFTLTDVGRWLRLQFGANIMVCKITDFVSPFLVKVSIGIFNVKDFPIDKDDATAVYNNGYADAFRLGAWCDTTGWPSKVTFHEQRLVLGKSSFQPTTVWGSKSGDYENHAPTTLNDDPAISQADDLQVLPDNAFTFTIASNRVNPISWMETGPAMLLGTIGSEFQLKATALNEPITPANVDMKEQTAFGSIQDGVAHRVGSAFIFTQRGGNKVREMTYDFTIDAFVSKDVTILSEHILRRGGGATFSASQQEPTSVVWFMLTDGSLASMTYERDQEVVAWARHVIGGSGVVESIDSVPSVSNPSYDDVYLIVRRTINGSTKRYVERIEIDFDTDRGVTQSDMFYVDCGVTHTGPSTNTISGLDHLNGATVQILADGNYVGTSVVSGGQVTLDRNASKIHVGFQQVAEVITLNPEGGSQAGTAQGSIGRINFLTMRLRDTLPFKHGMDPLNLSLIQQVDFTGLTSGDIRVSLDTPYDFSRSYILRQDLPYAFSIVALMPKSNINE